MKNPIQAMFEAGVVEATDFPPESRYHGLPARMAQGPDGTTIPYLSRRLVPDPERFADLRERRVAQGERLDQIAAAEIGDAEAWWQLCDANGAIWPDDLETLDTRLRLTLPADVPGATDEA
jgi:hypothetical protein